STTIVPVEVGAMPARSAPAAVAEAVPSLSVPTGTSNTGSAPGDSASGHRVADAEGLLQWIGSASPSDLESWFKSEPRLVDRLLVAPPPPERVTAWWNSLGAGSRAVLFAQSSHVVGNLDGVPYGARDRANRSTLDRSIEQLRHSLTTSGRSARAAIEQRLEALAEVQRALGSGDAKPRR